ncbi:MAG: thioredoxin [Ignavibacteriae bacterium]|nr:thioredoxin [Ignavibacteriota bacterium]
MKKHLKGTVAIFLVLGLSVLTSCSKKEEPKTELKTGIKTQNVNSSKSNDKSKLEHLTKETFKTKVFDYEKNKDWKFEGKRPAIIDFYADWCGPCKMVAPVLEEISNEYDGKVDIYKVDTEAQQELASIFGIKSIPSILFVPANGQPQMSTGAMAKDGFVKAINEILQVQMN